MIQDCSRLIIRHPASRLPERRYIFSVLLELFLGIEYDTEIHDSPFTTMCMAGRDRPAIHIPDTLLGVPDHLWLTTASLPPKSSSRLKASLHHGVPSEDVPVIYGVRPRTENPDVFAHTNDGLQIAIDIFSSAFYMLTRYEELVCPDRDSCDRFPASASFAMREGFLDVPVVNVHLELLWQAMTFCWPSLRRTSRHYRLLLSHDLDDVSTLGRPFRFIVRSMGADMLLRREPALAARKLMAWAETKRGGEMIDRDPYNTFDFIMDTSESLGLQSSFYVVPMGGHPWDPSYTMQQPWMRKLLRHIDGRGHELGYHASYETFRNGERTRLECQYLRQVLKEEGIKQEIQGGRQHFLRWANPVTWQNWESCGLMYDSTLGYADRAGFRCGCCFEYPVWDFISRRQLKLRERPLVVMESSLFTYQGLSLSEAQGTLSSLAQTCRRYGGNLTLLWHNSMLLGMRAQETYRQIVTAARN